MNETKNNYEAPRVEVVEVEVEKGYSVSQPQSIPYGNN